MGNFEVSTRSRNDIDADRWRVMGDLNQSPASQEGAKVKMTFLPPAQRALIVNVHHVPEELDEPHSDTATSRGFSQRLGESASTLLHLTTSTRRIIMSSARWKCHESRNTLGVRLWSSQ